MKFAKWVYAIAGVYGLVVTVPLYFLEGQMNGAMPPPINHPEYYYGFLGVTVAWQFLFLLVATDPVRYRLLMLPTLFEKFNFPIAVSILVLQGRTPSSFLFFPTIDVILGILFAVSFYLTGKEKSSRPS